MYHILPRGPGVLSTTLSNVLAHNLPSPVLILSLCAADPIKWCPMICHTRKAMSYVVLAWTVSPPRPQPGC